MTGAFCGSGEGNMAICPFDMKSCCDDLCYGGGCIHLPEFQPLRPCSGCGELIGIHGGDADDCTCEPVDDDDGDDVANGIEAGFPDW